MTNAELDELIRDCPTLYHMAERGAWPSIRERGLLSTTALLDLYGITGEEREAIESQHRPTGRIIRRNDLPKAVIRDQMPMNDSGLRRCLPGHMQPRDWYELLNKKVFFWLTHDRLCRLTKARAYRKKAHDVLEVDTKSLVEKHRDRIWLCPMNSGNTKPYPYERSESTFSRIDKYPYHIWRKKRKSGERVVELAIDCSVPDIVDHVIRVVIMRGMQVEKVLYE